MVSQRKRYSDEFKARAVRLYVEDDDATLRSVSENLGVAACTLSVWVKNAGEGKLTRRSDGISSDPALDVASQAVVEEEVRRLKRENDRLRKERDILREASKVFLRTTD